MTTQSLDESTDQRVLRGIQLYNKYHDKIENLGMGRYSIPSEDGNGSYSVDLGIFHDAPERESCECADFTFRRETCKHLVCASIYRAKAVQRQREKIAERKHQHPKRSAEEVLANLAGMGA